MDSVLTIFRITLNIVLEVKLIRNLSSFQLDDKMFDDNFVNIREEATPRAINILLVFMADCRHLPDMPFGYYFRSPDEEVRQNPKAKIVNVSTALKVCRD